SPLGCGTPRVIRWVISVSALPTSIWPQEMSYLRPSSEVDLVRPVTACLAVVYAIDCGRGTCAEIEPLLMIRPPIGCCSFIMRKACWVHRNVPSTIEPSTPRQRDQ